MKKSIISFILMLVLIVIPTFTMPASAYTLTAGIEITAKSAALMNVETGSVVYSKNADERVFPASTTKLMTALVVSEHVSDYNEIVSAYDSVVTDFLGTDASSIDLLPGEQMSIKDLLHALLIPSACDAANALAYHICGNIEDFVALMNQKAAELGMTGTNYVNAHGLHEDMQYTTASDLLKLANAVIQVPLLKEICGINYYVIPATNLKDKRPIFTTNFMMNANSRWYYRRIKGLKTGFTEYAGRCLVSLAEKDGQEYICVVMGCPNKNEAGQDWHYECEDTDALVRWAYNNLVYTCTVNKDTPVGEIKVNLCKETDHMLVIPKEDFYAMIPSNSKESIIVEQHLKTSEVNAPIQQGQVLGYATVFCAGEEIGTVDLIASDNCKKSGWLTFISIIKIIISSVIFRVIIALIIILITGFIILNIRYNQKRRRMFKSKMRNR